MTKTYTLSIDTSGTVDGSQLGALALAVGWQEWEDVDIEQDIYSQEAIMGELESMNHENIFISLLNEYGKGQGWIMENKRNIPISCDFLSSLRLIERPSFQSSPLLFGAWYALTDEYGFKTALNSFIEHMRDCATERNFSEMPEVYCASLLNAEKDFFDYTFSEYLHGDRSSHGLLHEGVKYLFARDTRNASIHYDKESDTLTIEASEEIVRDYLIDNLIDNEGESWTAEEIARNFSDALNRSKVNELKKRKERREKQRKEWQEQKEYERNIKENARDARIAELEAMTK